MSSHTTTEEDDALEDFVEYLIFSMRHGKQIVTLPLVNGDMVLRHLNAGQIFDDADDPDQQFQALEGGVFVRATVAHSVSGPAVGHKWLKTFSSDDTRYLKQVCAPIPHAQRQEIMTTLAAERALRKMQREQSASRAMPMLVAVPKASAAPPKADLSKLGEMTLIDALRDRGNVVSAWGVEDLSFLDDAQETQYLSDDDLLTLKQSFLAEVGSGLADALGQKGNDYLGQMWEDQKDEFLARHAKPAVQRQR